MKNLFNRRLHSPAKNGFTLVELVVVVAIIGILIAIAYPNYNQYLQRGSREAMQAELLRIASLQEKIYLNSNSYAPSANLVITTTNVYNGTSAGGLTSSATSEDGNYTITMSTPTGCNGGATPCQSFVLTATPITGLRQATDTFGAMSFGNDGTKTRNAETATPITHW